VEKLVNDMTRERKENDKTVQELRQKVQDLEQQIAKVKVEIN